MMIKLRNIIKYNRLSNSISLFNNYIHIYLLNSITENYFGYRFNLSLDTNIIVDWDWDDENNKAYNQYIQIMFLGLGLRICL